MDNFKQGYIIAEEYEIVTPLSQGSFGRVFLGRSKTKNMNVAIKVEKNEMSHFNSLSKEVNVYI
jgi:serine/threonine protein kinase